MESIELNNKRIINAWAMFDWANSSFALVIAVAVFPLYFNNVIDPEFTFLGMQMTNTALFSYSLSFAYLIISLMLPLLSGMADYGGKKIFFMKLFTTIGSLGCIALVFFKTHINLDIALIGFILAVIGFAGGQVFYNSYLPLIASEDQYDRVSAKGFTYGYIGSVILLAINLVMIQKPEWFGLKDAGIASRISFVMVGVW
ncbi:MAG: MFS transporter, partial [Bacteroidota bacterium]